MLEYLLATSAVANGWSAYFQSLLKGLESIFLPFSPQPREPERVESLIYLQFSLF